MKPTQLIACLILATLFACSNNQTNLKMDIENSIKSFNANKLLVPTIDQLAKLDSMIHIYEIEQPADTLLPKYYYNLADLYSKANQTDKALSKFDYFISHFSNHRYLPNALFTKAFLLDEGLGNKQEAAKAYQTFLQKFPNHALASSASMMYEQIVNNISNDSLLKKLTNQ
ncbi:MAG: Outer rane lipoprotein [Bacteroidota bacterium]|jgi:tetratricopeptide (TPR) repeat protein